MAATALLVAGCLTDAATRIAYDIEEGAGKVGREDGSRHLIQHRTPSKAGECVAGYKVQVDKVGMLVIWCKDAQGAQTVSSHSTTYHSRYADTPSTHILDKNAGEPLLIELERRGSRVQIAGVR